MLSETVLLTSINFEVAENILQCRARILAQQLPSIDVRVTMATKIKQKALNEFLLTECTEQSINGTTPKMNKLKSELTSIINEEGNSKDILNIKSQIKELVDKVLAKALKNRKNYSVLEDEVILLNKEKPNFNPTKEKVKKTPSYRL